MPRLIPPDHARGSAPDPGCCQLLSKHYFDDYKQTRCSEPLAEFLSPNSDLGFFFFNSFFIKESGVSLNRKLSPLLLERTTGSRGNSVDCHSFPKPNLCVAVFFRACLRKNRFQWRSHQFMKENAQHVAIGLIESSRRHGFVLSVSLGDI